MTGYRRRTLLGTAGCIILAGCVEGDGGSDDQGEASDDQGESGTDADGDEDAISEDDRDDELNGGDERSDSDDTDDGGDADDTTDVEDELPPDMDEEDVDVDRLEDVARLPDRSPLSNTLRDLYVVRDPEAFAAGRERVDLDDGAVKVVITLEPDEALPDGYLVSEEYSVGETVGGYVAIADLVDLGLEEAVRAVGLPAPTETHD